MNPELSVILVNFNDQAHLWDCLSSLGKGTTGLTAEVILVDNNSQDGSQELVHASFPWVRLIQNAENLGYAKANNIGIMASRGEFILFLNTDTVVPPEALPSLLVRIKARPEFGAIGPALIHKDKSIQVSFGKRVDFFSEIWQKFILNPYYKHALKRSSNPREAGWLSGACLLTRRAAVEDAGLFDENFFIYFEDIDLCVRLRERGWKLGFFPGIRVSHVGGATTSARKFQARLENRRSQLYFYRKHNSKTSLLLLRIYLKLNLTLFCLFRLRKPEDKASLRSEMTRIFREEKIS
jgi:GT2 family glycosyltransferase